MTDSKLPVRPKLFYMRSNGDVLQAVMTLPDGTNIIADIDLDWARMYLSMQLDWFARKIRGGRPA